METPGLPTLDAEKGSLMDDPDDKQPDQSDQAWEDLLDAAMAALAWLERNTTGDGAEAQKLRAAIEEAIE